MESRGGRQGAGQGGLAGRAAGARGSRAPPNPPLPPLQAEPLLEPLARTHKHPAVRGAVVELLTMLCFVGSEGAAETLHTMHTLWRVVLGGARAC